MSKRKVPLWQNPRGFAVVDTEATRGATIGTNVWNPDGSLFDPGAVATPSEGQASAVVIWRRVLEVPANVTALANTATTGLYAITAAGESATRTIEGVAGETTSANEDGIFGNPTIGLADVPNAGGGTLQRTAFDGKGRRTGASAATTDDLTEGAGNLYHTAARVRATVLTGLSTATSAVIAATDTVLSALGKLQAQITALGSTVSNLITQTITPGDTTHAPSGGAVADALAALIPPGYIDGLQMVWVSGTALTVTSGAASIESGGVLKSPTAIAKAGLSLSASTWYHVYLFDNAGTPDIEIVTTAPVAYNGTARSKTGDTSRRYVGSVKTDGAAEIFNFTQSGVQVRWRVATENFFRQLGGGTATVETTVSLAAGITETSTLALIRLSNLADAQSVATGVSGDSIAGGAPAAGILVLGPQGDTVIDHPVSDAQSMTYWYSSPPSGGAAYIDVIGYTYGR